MKIYTAAVNTLLTLVNTEFTRAALKPNNSHIYEEFDDDGSDQVVDVQNLACPRKDCVTLCSGDSGEAADGVSDGNSTIIIITNSPRQV